MCESLKYINFEENMGMHGLSALLKEVAREVVDLRDCCDDGVVPVDGHFLVHSVVATDDGAEALVLENDEVPLFEYFAAELRPLVCVGWTNFVVFD